MKGEEIEREGEGSWGENVEEPGDLDQWPSLEHSHVGPRHTLRKQGRKGKPPPECAAARIFFNHLLIA